MRLLTALTFGLLGVLPGLVVLATGAMITNGGDGMVEFGLAGLALIAIGAVFGLVVGWRRHDRYADRGIAMAFTSLAVGLTILALSALTNAQLEPDPILDARDCLEIYELLGSGELAGTRELPFLTPSEAEQLEEKLDQFEEGSPNDPLCQRLRDDLEAQTFED